MYGITIEGSFTFVEAGSGAEQVKPYRPLADVFKEYIISRKEGISGDLVGFRCPSILKGIGLRAQDNKRVRSQAARCGCPAPNAKRRTPNVTSP
jgi:Alpha-acetolactate decarboxylase